MQELWIKFIIADTRSQLGGSQTHLMGKKKILYKRFWRKFRNFTKSNEEVLEVSRKLHDAYLDEEQYWEQKSRTTWRTYGDRNSKKFHALT